MQIILIEDLLHIFTLGKNFTIMHNNYNIQNKSRLHWIFNFLKWFSSDAPGSNEKYTLKCFSNKDKHRTKIRAVEFKRTIRCEKGSKKTCLIILTGIRQMPHLHFHVFLDTLYVKWLPADIPCIPESWSWYDRWKRCSNINHRG